MKKYEIVAERHIEVPEKGVSLFQIRALRDIPRWNVRAGNFGGWIASEENLSQQGDCWVREDAYVADFAHVAGNALIGKGALVRDYAHVGGNARVSGERTWIGDSAIVDGGAEVLDGIVEDNAAVHGGAEVIDARVGGQAELYDAVAVCNSAYVRDVALRGTAEISGPVDIAHWTDYVHYGPMWDDGYGITFYRTRSGQLWIAHPGYHGLLGSSPISRWEDGDFNRHFLQAIRAAKALLPR